MINHGTNPLSDQQKERLRKEQRTVRKVGIILFALAVIFIPIASAIHYMLVGVSGILGAVGGILIARSYVHVKYQALNNQNESK